MLMAIYLFEKSYLQIVTITFTALILSEILNVYTEVKKYEILLINDSFTNYTQS